MEMFAEQKFESISLERMRATIEVCRGLGKTADTLVGDAQTCTWLFVRGVVCDHRRILLQLVDRVHFWACCTFAEKQ